MIIEKNTNITDGLNEEQQLAVQTTEGFIRVIAGAGSGKTKTLARRFAYLVDKLGISTSQILSVTFTNKAANEMKARIRSLIGDSDLGMIGTFHAFCTQVLREDISKINFPTRFLILDNVDKDYILNTVYSTCNIKGNDISISKAKELVSDLKTRKRTGEYLSLFSQTNDTGLYDKYITAQSIEDKIFYGYIYEQRKIGGLDFNDLIILTVHILESFNDVLKKWQNKIEYIMVDEFQDVSLRQFRLCQLLSQKHKNLFVVGDPDQTIYSWRGADVHYLIDFDKNFKDTQTIIMAKNYRSASNIIEVSNSLIKNNKERIEKELIATRQTKNKTLYFHAKDTKEEANWISKQILSLSKSGMEYKEIAILYRANYVSRQIEETLMQHSVPYVLYSGVKFYERKEIKDVLSYLRMLVNADDISFLRTVNEPKRNIGNKRVAYLKQQAKQNHCTLYAALKNSLEEKIMLNTGAKDYVELIEKFTRAYRIKDVSDLLEEILNESGYEEVLKLSGDEERLNNIAELKQSISEYIISSGEEVGLEDYLSKIALYTDSDNDSNKNCVKLMTVHAAKGLEFPAVFVCGMNEGIFPGRKVTTIEELEEERRVAYVAFTRAKDVLFLSEAEGYNHRDYSFRYPSRFIFNIEKEKIDFCVELNEQLVEDATGRIALDESAMLNIKNNKFLQVGDNVAHETFGIGKVIDVDNQSIVVKFDNLDTYRTLSRKAPLSRIGQ